ncbi:MULTISPECIES: hypothetical protein [unclassified Pedobacter]|uniref:hypothetical protein n=1 Tax=Pedobacter TaxID=84567 RepID=UPI000B4AFFB8|nr:MULTISPECIES: hypothetical protein [unclassified Pedobacter]MCX2431333.1 hypothetical protein [Pedobacter sp. GR22-10]MCX2585060.1 hypothetical protein [Pedobacter sp. MR22-3]OWK71739.1 hypothetical protein CBW18_04525 [Pedobacter sp. AJM]
MKKLCLIIPLYLIPFFVFAEYGCLVPGYPELLTHQSNPPGGTFSNTPGEIYPEANCAWTLDMSMPSAGCVGHGKAGKKGTYYQACPIDDFIPLLFIFTAGISFLTISKRLLPFKNENIHYHGHL